ncbi:MAG TPA: FecR domain-containing protein, partial [Thermodesulfobacteriota bacterium]|nr:FecR domain-containing protein [Thermodesulfobacteriota bacterium]
MRRRACFLLFFVAPIFFICLHGQEGYAQTCAKWVARAVSLQGGVQCLRMGEREWRAVEPNDRLCPGDMIRVQKLGRADIVLSNEATLRLDQNTAVTFAEPEEEKTLSVRLTNGAAYFFSRIRRSL